MANDAIFYFDNLTEKGTFTATSEESEHPVENLQDRNQHSDWQAGNTTNPQVFTLDLGSAMAAGATTIVAVNLYSKSVGMKLIVDQNDQASFANPVYLVGDAGSYHAPASGDHPIWHETFISKTKRYWRWQFNCGGDTDVLISDIYLWPKVDTGRHPGGPWDRSYSSAVKAITGSGIFAQRTREPAEERGLSFQAITKTVRDAMLAGFEICDVYYKPFLYLDEYGAVHLLRFTGEPKTSHHIGPTHTLTMQVIEDY